MKKNICIFKEEGLWQKWNVPFAEKKFDEEYVEYLDNGNPACPRCVEEERKQEESNQKRK